MAVSEDVVKLEKTEEASMADVVLETMRHKRDDKEPRNPPDRRVAVAAAGVVCLSRLGFHKLKTFLLRQNFCMGCSTEPQAKWLLLLRLPLLLLSMPLLVVGGLCWLLLVVGGR